MTNQKEHSRRRFLTGLGTLALVALAACSKQSSSPTAPSTSSKRQRSYTGVVLSPEQLKTRLTIAGLGTAISTYSSAYAEVSHDWLLTFADRYQAELFANGIKFSDTTGASGWLPTFNCQIMAMRAVTDAHLEYSTDAAQDFHPPGAPFLAMVRIHYTRDTDAAYAKTQGVTPDEHEILVVCTDKGPVFWDSTMVSPITTLSQTELSTINYREA